MNNLAKRAAGALAACLHSVLGVRDVGPLGIVVYHRVSPSIRGIPAPTLNVTPSRFRQQLVGLQKIGYRFVSLEQALQRHALGHELPARSVIVTFDDAFGNVATRAYPILEELGIPATVFVSTAFLDSPACFPFDSWARRFRNWVPADSFRPLTTAECHELRRSGLIELGCHTHTHQDLRGRPAEFRDDMLACLESLRTLTGGREPSFAFPFGRRGSGHSGDDLMAVARDVGVRCALTTEAETVRGGQSPFGWGRFNVYDWDSAQSLAAKLQGWYGWAPALQEYLRGQRVN